MRHIAIMKSSWGLLPKILDGHKTVETRWYRVRTGAWNAVHAGDTIFFADSGAPCTVRTDIARVLQFENLDTQRAREIFVEYQDVAALEEHMWPLLQEKRYCGVMFLEDVQTITPFAINKKGYGVMSAWLSLRT